MTRDPEAHAQVHTAVWYAWSAWEPTNGTPLKRFIAKCVQRNIWDYWRRRAKRPVCQKAEAWWADVHRDGDGRNQPPYDGDDCEARPGWSPRTEADATLQDVDQYGQPAEYIELPNGSMVTRDEWQALWTHFVDKMPYDVVARRAGCRGTLRQLRKVGKRLVQEALSEL